MAAETTPTFEEALAQLDWSELRAAARSRLRARLSGFCAQDIDDATQDVLTHMVTFVKRHGPPERPEGLLIKIVRAVAADAIGGRQRDRAFNSSYGETWLEQQLLPADVREVLRRYRENSFHVREYFRLKRAECVPLADARSRGESLKDHAARGGQSYPKIRQAWSRCVKMVHDAMRRNRLRLAWPTPRERSGAHE
jgi:DNA-directed RNA polymerase specialized sigma24 family protein